MFNLFDAVEITEGVHKGKFGTIIQIHPNIDDEIVYMVNFDNSNNKGMFKQSELFRAQ